MHFNKAVLGLIAVGTVTAQRPSDQSICDYYTTALLTDNTGANQYTLLTLLVNTVVIGNYTQPNTGVAVSGILAAGKYLGVDVNLLPYFDGTLKSSNGGGAAGVSVNFLDGGGAAPLLKNMPASDTTSAQYFLLTHLYQFFGALLGCTNYGKDGFPAYMGDASMYSVHKFMDLNPYEVGYFIEQVANAAASFGVATDDITAVGWALNDLFDVRCAAPTTVIPSQGDQLHSICTDGSCSLADNFECDSYDAVTAPADMTTGMTHAAPGSYGNSGNNPMTNCTVDNTPTADHYRQCGGTGWTGPTRCSNGYTCTNFNPYYSQCV